MKRIPMIASIILLFAAFGISKEIIALGEPGTEGELIFPRLAKTGPEGRIYVYDQADAFIKVYSPEGRLLRKIGGKGQGPGEIQRAEGVSFGFTTEGKLFFTEYFAGHPWITVLETDGTLIRVIKPQVKEFFGISRAVSLPGNRFLVQMGFLGKPEKKEDYFLHRSPRELVLMDGEGQIVSRIIRTDHITRISYLDRGADSPIPFVPMFAWCLYGEDSVVFSEGVETRLRVYDFEGNLVKEIQTSLPEPEKVTKKDLAEWRKRRKEMMSRRDPEWWAKFGRVTEKYKKSLYPRKPLLFDILRTPEARFLVASRREAASLKGTYWLLDATGERLLELSTPAWIMDISPRYILYGEMDEDGIPSIKALKRRGTEQEDLLLLQDRPTPF
ncbi:MAG: hypothetical protein ACE5LV_02100 [Candidatus Aminicenantales bacterium]